MRSLSFCLRNIQSSSISVHGHTCVNFTTDTGRADSVKLIHINFKIVRQMSLRSMMAGRMLSLWFLLLLTACQQTLQTCDKDTTSAETCTNKPESGEAGTGCGCSGTSRQNSGKREDDDSSDPSRKYTSSANVQSPYTRTNQMAPIPGGTFTIGSDKPIILADGEGPSRKVTLEPFYLDVHEVSNSEFELFVNSTKFVTEVRKI